MNIKKITIRKVFNTILFLLTLSMSNKILSADLSHFANFNHLPILNGFSHQDKLTTIIEYLDYTTLLNQKTEDLTQELKVLGAGAKRLLAIQNNLILILEQIKNIFELIKKFPQSSGSLIIASICLTIFQKIDLVFKHTGLKTLSPYLSRYLL